MYRFGIWLIALSLVFNGVAAFAWNDAQGIAAAMTQDHHDGADADACNIASGDGIAGAVEVGQTRGDKHNHQHNHLKCCGTCNVVSLLPNVTAVPVTFLYKAADFHTAQRNLIGHLVGLDPDIPKSIV